MRLLRASYGCLLLLGSATGVIYAEAPYTPASPPAPADLEATETASLSLADALARALKHSPSLQVYDPSRRAAEAERLQAGTRPNPELAAEFENLGGTGEVRGTRALETTLTLSQLVELGGKRDRRVAVAEGALATLEAEYAVARLDVLAETAQRMTDVAQAQTQVALAQRATDLVQQTQAAVEKRICVSAASSMACISRRSKRARKPRRWRANSFRKPRRR